MRATPQTRFKNRMVGLTGARIAGDLHFMFLDEGRQALGIHRVDLSDDKAVARHSRRKLLCEDGFEISQHNTVKALEFVQFLPDNRSNSADSDDHRICHKVSAVRAAVLLVSRTVLVAVKLSKAASFALDRPGGRA